MANPELGPTGEYPNGMASPDDNGALAMRLTVRGPLVVIEFGAYIDWIANDAAGTREFARKLIECASKIDGKPL